MYTQLIKILKKSSLFLDKVLEKVSKNQVLLICHNEELYSICEQRTEIKYTTNK